MDEPRTWAMPTNIFIFVEIRDEMNYGRLVFPLVFLLCVTSCRERPPSITDAVSLVKNNGRTEFTFQDAPVFSRDSIVVKKRNLSTEKFPVIFENNIFTAELGSYGTYSEKLHPRPDGSITGDIELTITSDEAFIVQCPFSIPKQGEKPYFMVPGFLYGSNNLATSDGKQPKFDYSGPVGWPNSSKFYMRADRSTHPGVITIKNGIGSMVGIKETMKDSVGKAVAIEQRTQWSPGYQYNGLMVDSHFEDKDVIGFQLGYENSPARYSWVLDSVPAADKYLFGWMEGLKGSTLKAESFYAFTQADSIPDYGKLLEMYYPVLHQKPLKRSSRKDAVEKSTKAIIKYSWQDDIMGFMLVDNSETGADIAWTGGMQVAYPLLKSSKYTGDAAARDIAYTYIDNLCETAVNEKANLLYEEFRDGKWNVTGWWGIREDSFDFGDDPLHSAYLNGQAAYYLLKSYELEGANRTKWLQTAQMVLETALRNQRDDGAFPVFFDPDTGDGVDYDGFQPCWFVPALALLYKYTQDKKYLEGAEKALQHYYGHHLKGELYNTPMDIHRGVDEEGNLAFITACVELHKITKKPVYVDLGIDGLSWEYSWKFAYNTVHSSEPLKSMDWSSCGGSITSNYNVSIHQMGNLVAGEMYYLYRQTGSDYIKSRLNDVCVWGLGTYNTVDNDFGFGKVGQATEQFFIPTAWSYPIPDRGTGAFGKNPFRGHRPVSCSVVRRIFPMRFLNEKWA